MHFSILWWEDRHKKAKRLSQEHSAKEHKQGAEADRITHTNKFSDNRDPAILPCDMNCKYENYSLNQQSGNNTVFLDDLVITKGQNSYQAALVEII